MRLFVAIELPEQVKAELGLICCGLPGARWVPPEQFHLTVCFIGETGGALRKAIHEALAIVKYPAFSVQLHGIGFFPPRKTPHTLWVGLKESDSLHQLHKKIQTKLTALGLEFEQRNFAPHVTLARLRNTPNNRIGNFLIQHSFFSLEPFQVKAFRLYRSILGRKGATHYVEEEYLLSQ